MIRTTMAATGGEHINSFAARMVARANKTREPISGVFNEIELTAEPGGDAATIVRTFESEMDARAKAYRESPAGIAAAEKRAAEIAARQKEYDALVARLPDLDMADRPAVLRWLCRFQDAADDIGVAKHASRAVIDHFAQHGLVAGMNCDEYHDKDNPENVFGWIVGQAMDGIERVGAPMGILHHFAEQWLAAGARKGKEG